MHGGGKHRTDFDRVCKVGSQLSSRVIRIKCPAQEHRYAEVVSVASDTRAVESVPRDHHGVRSPASTQLH